MTKVTITNTKEQTHLFSDLEVGDAYYTLDYPDIPCIKVTNEHCLFCDTDYNEWTYAEEKYAEPVVKIDAEIKFTY